MQLHRSTRSVAAREQIQTTPQRDHQNATRDKDGHILFTEGMKAQKFFTKEKIRELLDGDNCELIRRMGMGVNLFAGSVECGLAALNLLKDPENGLDKLGFKGAASWSQELAEVAEYLNNANQGDRTKKETQQNVKKLLQVMQTMDEHLMKDIAKMTDASARLYNFGVNVMSLKALTSKLKHWAKHIPEQEKQTAAVRKFIKEPTEANLITAFVAALEEKAEKTRKKKISLEDSDSEEAADSDDSDGNSDSSGSASESDSSSSSSEKQPRKKTKKSRSTKGQKKAAPMKKTKKKAKRAAEKKEKGKKKDKADSDAESVSSEEEAEETPAKKDPKKAKKRSARV